MPTSSTSVRNRLSVCPITERMTALNSRKEFQKLVARRRFSPSAFGITRGAHFRLWERSSCAERVRTW